MLSHCAGAHIARRVGVSQAPTSPRFGEAEPPSSEGPPGRRVVLIFSSDPVAAALLGALIETLGYLVRFYRPQVSPDEQMRRDRPTVAMLDCEDPTLMNDEILGRARMRGVSVVIFGSSEALRQVRSLAEAHQLQALLMPATLDDVDEVIRKAVERVC